MNSADAEMLAESYRSCFSAGREEGLREGRKAERDRIRTELEEWLIGHIDPSDAGLYNSRRIVDEISRICPVDVGR